MPVPFLYSCWIPHAHTTARYLGICFYESFGEVHASLHHAGLKHERKEDTDAVFESGVNTNYFRSRGYATEVEGINRSTYRGHRKKTNEK